MFYAEETIREVAIPRGVLITFIVMSVAVLVIIARMRGNGNDD